MEAYAELGDGSPGIQGHVVWLSKYEGRWVVAAGLQTFTWVHAGMGHYKAVAGPPIVFEGDEPTARKVFAAEAERLRNE
jgi:hypothetical protein